MRPIQLSALAFIALATMAPDASALTISMSESFTCTSQEECKRKCKEAGGRWKKDKTGTTHGTCSKPASITLEQRIEILSNQLGIAQEQKRLRDDKRFPEWSNQPTTVGGSFVVELKPSECAGLGGEVYYDDNCRSGVMCVTEANSPTSGELELFFQCVDELDGAN